MQLYGKTEFFSGNPARFPVFCEGPKPDFRAIFTTYAEVRFIKSESFFKGTLILISANAVSKILGAILKIPLTYILGEQGMAIYQTAFSVYIMLLSLITSGMPFAISRLTAEELALGKYGNVRFAMRFSVLVMSVLGILASLIMFFGADFFAFSMKDPKAQLAIKCVAPSIFFVAFGAVYKSCYQGYSCQTPTAVSQVLEAFIKLIAGYGLASWFAAFSVKYSSAAAISGVTAGEFFATAVLFLMYIPFRRELRGHPPEDSRRKIISSIASVALPMTAISLVSSGLSLLETSVIRNLLTSITFTDDAAMQFMHHYSPYTQLFDKLISEKRLSFDGARWLFGAYSGYAATVFNLPAGILASFGVSILPVVTSSVALGNRARLQKTVSAAAKTVLTISIPCAAILAIFSEQILTILFKNTASSLMLTCMAPLLIIVTLSQLVGAVQHAAGKIMTPFWYSLICTLIKITLSYILVGIPHLNILGAIISSFISNGIYLILNIRSLGKELEVSVISGADIAKISASAAIMSVSGILTFPLLMKAFNSVFLAFAACMLISAAVYCACLFLFSVIKKGEITRLFR